MKRDMRMILITLLIVLAGFAVYVFLNKDLRGPSAFQTEISKQFSCPPMTEKGPLIESGIYIGTTEDGREIAPGENQEYDISEKAPSWDPYYLTCYYGAENYIQLALPESVTRCAYEDALLVCS